MDKAHDGVVAHLRIENLTSAFAHLSYESVTANFGAFTKALEDQGLDYSLDYRQGGILVTIRFERAVTQFQSELAVKVVLDTLMSSKLMQRPMVSKIDRHVAGARGLMH